VASYPHLVQTVLDTTDVRRLAEFYRQLLGLRYRPGDEPTDDEIEGPDWLVLRDASDVNRLAFQQVEHLEPTTWPAPDIPMQMHLDLCVPDEEELERQRERAESLGARLRLDRSTDPAEPLYVLVDPAGHPFCIFVA
jgi:catechol 2,3-dioxygenase-like lactoylglutathione lyase family enzyme